MTRTGGSAGRSPPAAHLAAFAARTFQEVFGANNTAADMPGFLDALFGERQQAAELADPALVTVVAEMEGRLTGYAQVRRNPAPASAGHGWPVELWRFSVDAACRGRGLARQLMDAAWTAAAELGAESLWLGVWERNPRAIAFYRKSGFRDAGTHDFWLGSDRQVDRVMVADAAARPGNRRGDKERSR